jgi:biotin carboxylase
MNVARQESIRIPDTVLIENVGQLRACFDRLGFPLVLKADGTSGGEGVRIVRTASEAESGFHKLQAPPLLARAAKRTLLDQDPSLLRSSIAREKYIISAQKFVPGTEANSAVVCWKGTILAALHFEVVAKKSAAGHSTVVRLIEGAEMMSAAEKIARRLNLSGLYGFDFMLEAATGHAHLIEINPRSTQVGHLSLGPGRDIPAALYAAATGQQPRWSEPLTRKDTIALFPQEWIRDSASPYLHSAYHDVPWEEPELIRACIQARKKQQKWGKRDSEVRSLSAVEAPRG